MLVPTICTSTPKLGAWYQTLVKISQLMPLSDTYIDIHLSNRGEMEDAVGRSHLELKVLISFHSSYPPLLKTDAGRNKLDLVIHPSESSPPTPHPQVSVAGHSRLRTQKSRTTLKLMRHSAKPYLEKDARLEKHICLCKGAKHRRTYSS